MPPDDLPNQNTDEGALVRLLIIEVGNQPGDPAGVREAMGLMKRVLENRLKSPQDFEARGATTMTQIIQAHGKHGKAEQFLGFKAYPKLLPGQQGALDKDMDAAATPRHQNDPVRYLIATAFAVARAPTPADPSPNGLCFWRTAGSGLNMRHFKLFRTVAGIDFYQKDDPAKKTDAHHNEQRNGPMVYAHGRPNTRPSSLTNNSNGPMTYPNKRPGPR